MAGFLHRDCQWLNFIEPLSLFNRLIISRMDSMKNTRKRKLKLLHCFQPVAMEEGKESSKEVSMLRNRREIVVCQQKKNGKQKFSSVAKALLFQISLKKLPKQNSGQISKPCSTNSSRKSMGNYQRIDSKVSCASKSSTAPASTSLKSSSSLKSMRQSSIGRKNKFNILPKEDQEKINFALDCLLLILMVMVFWGRICAIFCTTTWLFLLLRRNGTRYWSEKCSTHNEVIRKGLMGRNHNKSTSIS